MIIVKSAERIRLTKEEKEILENAYDLLDKIYGDAEDPDIYNNAEKAKNSIVELLEEYCEE